MKRKLLTISAMLLCSILSVTAADVQQRRGNTNRHESHSTVRPGRGGSGNTNIRPGSNNNRPKPSGNNNFRPGSNNNRPQQPGNNNFRPGSNNNRPQQPGNNNFRPGNNVKPGNGTPPKPAVTNRPTPQRPPVAHRPAPARPPQHRPSVGYRPGPNRPAYIRPVARPGRPPVMPWTRPVPPAHWRPTYTGSLFGNILGLTFGIAMGTALDNLYYSGYSIDGYMNNQVYLNGVSQFNAFWPDATLYFGNGGGLVRSQFFDPTIGYDTARFYSVYSTLCGLYGVPAINNTSGLSLNATWFGRGGDYITLQYQPMSSGNYNYFTVLTMGR